MPTTDEPNNDDGLTLLDQKRALEDEIWFLAIAENYARGRLKGVLSREEVIAKYEVRRRFAPDHASKTTAEWAREMLAWLRDEHPNAPPATEKTLKNRLPGLLRQLKARAK